MKKIFLIISMLCVTSLMADELNSRIDAESLACKEVEGLKSILILKGPISILKVSMDDINPIRELVQSMTLESEEACSDIILDELRSLSYHWYSHPPVKVTTKTRKVRETLDFGKFKITELVDIKLVITGLQHPRVFKGSKVLSTRITMDSEFEF